MAEICSVCYEASDYDDHSCYSFIIVCLLPLRTANLQFPGVEALPEKSDTRTAYESYEESFHKIVKEHADVTLILETKKRCNEKENLQQIEDVVQN